MLNKRIKSMLVVGLLVVGMSGNAFALDKTEYDGNDGKGQCSHTVSGANKLENPSAGEHILGGVIKITVSADKKYAKVEPLKDDYGYDLAKIKAVHMKGGDGYNCYVLEEGETWVENLSCPLNNGGKIPDISHITVDYKVVPESERPIPGDKSDKPIDPGAGGTQPPTGDASMTSIVAIAAVSVAGLFALKKDDDEE